MNKEELKIKIKGILEKMNCKNINFDDSQENRLIVFFDSKEIISFKADILNWKYSGIQLAENGVGEKDSTTEKPQFKIIFQKL